MQQPIVYKSIIRDFYRRAVGQGDIAFADAIIAEDYSQHSRGMKPGKAGVLEALRAMKNAPRPATPSTPFMRLVAEGEYVVTNLSFDWGGKQKVVVDLFRFRDGQVAEHWDVVEDAPEATLNGHALMDGTAPLGEPTLTAENKPRATAFYQRVFIERDRTALPHLVSENLIQHIPEIANGLAGLEDFLKQSAPAFCVEKIHRIIAEGDFVVFQSEGQWAQQATHFFHIFRLSVGKIQEQWGVKQRIS